VSRQRLLSCRPGSRILEPLLGWGGGFRVVRAWLEVPTLGAVGRGAATMPRPIGAEVGDVSELDASSWVLDRVGSLGLLFLVLHLVLAPEAESGKVRRNVRGLLMGEYAIELFWNSLVSMGFPCHAPCLVPERLKKGPISHMMPQEPVSLLHCSRCVGGNRCSLTTVDQ